MERRASFYLENDKSGDLIDWACADIRSFNSSRSFKQTEIGSIWIWPKTIQKEEQRSGLK